MADAELVLDHFLPYRLSYTANLVSEHIAGAYKSLFSLSIPEWRVIAHAAEHNGITQLDIGRISRMDKVTVSRAAIALGARGLIERAGNPTDRRSHLIRLSAAGWELYAQVAPKALELERSIFGRFSKVELEGLTAMLRRIDDAALEACARPGSRAAESADASGQRGRSDNARV